jgi:hypothetical protein
LPNQKSCYMLRADMLYLSLIKETRISPGAWLPGWSFPCSCMTVTLTPLSMTWCKKTESTGMLYAVSDWNGNKVGYCNRPIKKKHYGRP